MARTQKRRQQEPYTRRFACIPKRDLAESVLHLAAPLLEPLGPGPALDDARSAVELAIKLWNAQLAASKLWVEPRPQALNELRAAMGSSPPPFGVARAFELLSARWREHFALDPRSIGAWSLDVDEQGKLRLVCEMTLPDGYEAKVPPPSEKRIAIGGRFLDETSIRVSSTSSLIFPVEHHRAAAAADGAVTVYTKMPTALQLFAEGTLPRVGGEPVQLSVGGKDPSSMVLAEVRCGGQLGFNDVAVLEFRPVETKDVHGSTDRMMAVHDETLRKLVR